MLLLRTVRRQVPSCVALAVVVFCGLPLDASAQAHYAGAIGPGSLYEIDVPAAWNGDLVLYAHGIVQESLPVVSAVEPGRLRGAPDALARRRVCRRGVQLLEQRMGARRRGAQDASARRHRRGEGGSAAADVPGGPFPRRAGHRQARGATPGTVRRRAGHVRAAGWRARGTRVRGQRARDLRLLLSRRASRAHRLPSRQGRDTFRRSTRAARRRCSSQVFGALSANPQATFQWATAARLPFASQTELGNSALYVIGFLLRYTNDLVARVNGKTPFDNQTYPLPGQRHEQSRRQRLPERAAQRTESSGSRRPGRASTSTSATTRRTGVSRFRC